MKNKTEIELVKDGDPKDQSTWNNYEIVIINRRNNNSKKYETCQAANAFAAAEFVKYSYTNTEGLDFLLHAEW